MANVFRSDHAEDRPRLRQRTRSVTITETEIFSPSESWRIEQESANRFVLFRGNTMVASLFTDIGYAEDPNFNVIWLSSANVRIWLYAPLQKALDMLWVMRHA